METLFTIEEFNKVKKIPVAFIMGKERSGTTLLQTFLNGHPNIVAPPEFEFVVLLYPRFGKIKKWSEKTVHDFITELYREPWISKIWRVDREKLTSMLMAIKDNADYASVCKVVYYYMRENKEDIILISDKNPIYVLFIKTILKIFPEAKFIHLVREPRDNVNSHLKSFKINNLRYIAMKWRYYNGILNKAKIRMPARFHTVIYEHLVEKPEVEMKKLCLFLGVTYTEKMTENTFPESLQKLVGEKSIYALASDIHVNLLKPVNTSNIGKWRKSLTPWQIQMTEAITGKFASKNYPYDISAGNYHLHFGQKVQILKSRIVYLVWQVFTRTRYRSYRLNKLYNRFNIVVGRETKAFGRVLREN